MTPKNIKLTDIVAAAALAERLFADVDDDGSTWIVRRERVEQAIREHYGALPPADDINIIGPAIGHAMQAECSVQGMLDLIHILVHIAPVSATETLH